MGEQIGILSLEEAFRQAEEKGLDLVEVAGNTTPPVCRIMDYGKIRYEKLKQERESKKKQKTFVVKEIRVRPKIGEHDYQVKLRHAQEFLKEGNKIKITLMFRGRELSHQDLGEKILRRLISDLAELAVVEQQPMLLSRFMIMVLAPK